MVPTWYLMIFFLLGMSCGIAAGVEMNKESHSSRKKRRK